MSEEPRSHGNFSQDPCRLVMVSPLTARSRLVRYTHTTCGHLLVGYLLAPLVAVQSHVHPCTHIDISSATDIPLLTRQPRLEHQLG